MNPRQYIKRPLAGLSRLNKYLADRLVRGGIVPGHRDYQPFIILGWYRTGSNYLLSMLNSHPDLVAFSEVFYQKKIFWGNAVYGEKSENSADFPLRNSDSAKFITKYIFRLYPRKIHAVGFKIFYPQLDHSEFIGLKPLLTEMKNLKVIHLKRENMLRILVSDLLAKQTGEKVSVSKRKIEKKIASVEPIYLDPEETRTYFENLKGFQEKFDAFFVNHNIKQVKYETLRRDPGGTVNDVYQFLNLEPRPSFSILIKQNTLPLRELVQNFDELSAVFSGTEWEKFFKD